ncbi:hypothetical protein EV385_6614 [Krasilnikovia cinnamomea]|uniref:Uncharacterized protein n=1 Tax=Krasilnikovia cinnamomea TaxID=349313 RepID=A0A4Q7Z7U8_9ACTN|nr:hypothetical protein [Krasilnikovia cinnamomea]RZU46540.1 hypothetical protein EV385_6614 [Krasilnikovia cinnamomea]
MTAEFVRHGALLVPVDTLEQLSGEAAELREQLAAERALQSVQREDVWTRRATSVQHELAMAEVDEQEATAKRARRERIRDAAEADELAALYRRAASSGARARIRALILGSAEMRALRIAKVRTVALWAGLPVLAAFAVWSTTGVQAGVVRLLDLARGSAAWAASWAVEPALIVIVALIIIGRAVLRSSGGDTDWRATVAEWVALGLSLALNILGGWHGGWSGLLTALPHAIGPLGCAGTAFLIGLFDSYTAAARPWDNAPRLDELGLFRDHDAPVLAAVPPAVSGGAPVPRTDTGRAVPARTGTGPGRPRPVPAAGTGRRPLTSRTGTPTGTGTGSPKAAARAFWDAETAAGRTPTGAELARAAGRDSDETGVFRRYARDWAAALTSKEQADVAS